MLIAISAPIWLAACLTLVIGVVGSFSSDIKGVEAWRSLAMLPTSSALFYVAARMCGIIVH